MYKEYGAKYEIVAQDVNSIGETLPGWEGNQKGLEVLSVLLSSPTWENSNARRASTLKDLLVKVRQFEPRFLSRQIATNPNLNSPYRGFADIR